jgi:hypothetical protein
MHLVVRKASSSDFEAMMLLCRIHGEPEAPNFKEWNSLWECDSTVGVVIEDISRREFREVAILVGAFVSDPFVSEAMTSFQPYILGRLSMRKNCLVPLKSVGRANAGEGLNLLMAYIGWVGEEYQVAPAPNLRAMVLNAFADRHGGNRLKYMFGEVGEPELMQLALAMGCRVVNDYEEWFKTNKALVGSRRPYLLGITRDEGLKTENQWVHKMFTYFLPKFHFTESQQVILVLAREGYTDSEIGTEIGVSPDAVKKRWSAIYNRVSDVFPDLLPESPSGGRGVEKRRVLLSHLRERSEELRPFERRAFSRPSRQQ